MCSPGGFHEQETEKEKKEAEYERRMQVLNQRRWSTTSHSARLSTRVGVVGQASLLIRRLLLRKKKKRKKEADEEDMHFGFYVFGFQVRT